MIRLMSLISLKLMCVKLRFAPSLVICLTLALVGCATTFKAETTVFHQWPNHTSSSLVYKFAPVSLAEQTLEREAYLQVARQMLADKGFRESVDGPLSLSLSYSSVEARRLVAGDPWLRPSVWAGGVFRSGGIVLGGSVPMGGVPARELVYLDRTLTIVLSDGVGTDSKRVYEGRSSSLDSGRDALAALPYLLRALLDGFPGPSGVTRQVSLPVSR
jgi:Domain of unknown function (DUF4136)